MWFTFGLRSKWQVLIWIDRKRWLHRNLMVDQSHEKSKSLIKENIPISPMWLFVHHHLGSLTIGRSKILDWLMNRFFKDWLINRFLNCLVDLRTYVSNLRNILDYLFKCIIIYNYIFIKNIGADSSYKRYIYL